MNVLYFDEIDSTNSYLKREYQKLENRTLVYCGHQTAGKGRLGRVWKDDSDSLMFSILLKETVKMGRMELLPLLCGVVLHLTLKELGIDSQIKWPNDILLGDRKCAGILLESIYEDSLNAVVIGIGINVNNTSFPDEIKDKACSLRMVHPEEIDKRKLLFSFYERFLKEYEKFLTDDDSFLQILKDHSYLDGKKVLLDYYGENLTCIVEGINKDGTLRVYDGIQRRDIKSGEVTLQSNYLCLSQQKSCDK
jgi:BirA family transcriptional regulator, biotin operon repressor / biotin---[acetyl-CoA-carboxylase] ligase